MIVGERKKGEKREEKINRIRRKFNKEPKVY